MKPCNKRTVLAGILLILLMTLITGYVIGKQFDINEVSTAIKYSNIAWFLPALLCMFAFSVGEAINISSGLKIAGYKTTFKEALKYAFAGFFFSSVTPSASGGQPAQLYYMNKDGIAISHGSFALLLELIGFETASIGLGFLGILVSIFSDINVFDGSKIVWLAIAGFSVNLILLSLILTIMFSHKAVKPLAGLAIKLTSVLGKGDNNKKKIFRLFSEYRWSAIKALKNKRILAKVILVSFLRLTAFHSITYFTYRALGLNSQSFFEVVFLQGLLFTSVSCIPLPGSSGAMEGGFGILFKSIFPAALLGSGIIISRVLSFAVPVIYTGLVLFIQQYQLFCPKKVNMQKVSSLIPHPLQTDQES